MFLVNNNSLPIRGAILEAASSHTIGDRDREYGSPMDNLTISAELQTAYINHAILRCSNRNEVFQLTAQDAAWLMVLTKISRTFAGNIKRDTYEDAAAYAAIAGECAELAQGNNE